MLKAIIKILGFFVDIAGRIKNVRRQKKDDEVTQELADLLTDNNKPGGSE